MRKRNMYKDDMNPLLLAWTSSTYGEIILEKIRKEKMSEKIIVEGTRISEAMKSKLSWDQII